MSTLGGNFVIDPVRVLTIRSDPIRSGPGGRFSKVPKLYGPFSGVAHPFVTQERKAFNSSNFKVIFLFVTFKTC